MKGKPIKTEPSRIAKNNSRTPPTRSERRFCEELWTLEISAPAESLWSDIRGN